VDLSWELRARRAEAHLAALDVAVQGISGVLELDPVLQLIVDRVRELAEAEYAALGIVDAEGSIERFITSGLDAAERERIGPPPRGRGLLGLIIREGETFRVADIATDPRRYGFPPNHPEMHSFLGVPVTVKGHTVGDLYLTNKRGAPEFSEDDRRWAGRSPRTRGWRSRMRGSASGSRRWPWSRSGSGSVATCTTASSSASTR